MAGGSRTARKIGGIASMKSTAKKVRAGAAAAGAAIAGSFLFTFRILKASTGRHDYKPGDWDPDAPVTVSKRWEDFRETFQEGKRFFLTYPREEVSILSSDGLRLTGYLLKPEEGVPVKGCLLLMHGYHGSPYHDFGVILPFYLREGYILLIPDERAHGKSEGKCLTFGIKERYDCQRWAQYLADRYPALPVFLDGISMGATVVLMASALPLPKQVRGIIADCGFTSPYEIARHVVKTSMHLPLFPTMPMAELACRVWSGYWMKSYSTVMAMQENTRPVLFVHGRADDFVPCYMTEQNYEACTAPKEAVYVEQAGHGLSYLYEKETCEKTLKRFLERYREQDVDTEKRHEVGRI